MDEVRRFLRYTLPGLAILSQFIIAVFITKSSAILNLLKMSITQGDIIGTVTGIFIGSGTIGFIFASIYHPLYWTLHKVIPFWGWERYRLSFLKQLLSDKKLEIQNLKGSTVDGNDLSERDAWTILTYYWYANIAGPDEPVKTKTIPNQLSNITNPLTDFAHASGAMFLGTLVGFIVWGAKFSYWSQCKCNCTDLVLSLCWAGLLVVYVVGFYLADSALERMAIAAISSHINVATSRPTIITFPRKQKCRNNDKRKEGG